jgi:putative intracellular protease/amidase
MKQAVILVYTSSATRVPHREGGSHEVGVFLGELVEPLEPLLNAGYRLEFVSPDGKGCTIDEHSFHLSYWGLSAKRLEHAKAVLLRLEALGLRTPMKLKDLLEDPEMIDRYDILFIPGGHAPMTDVLHVNWLESDAINAETGELLLHFYQAKKPTALICHGVAALAAAPEIDGKWLYDGYRMTCVSMLGEKVTEDIPFFNVGGHMPDYPVRILERKGALVTNVMLGKSLVVEDRELITGQDPMAAQELGRKLLLKIEKYLQKD